MKKRILILAMAGGLVLGLVGFATPTPGKAAYPAAENLSLTQQCTSPITVGATLRWTNFMAGDQWIDVSYYNDGFAPGTFVSMGPLPYYQTAFAGDSLTPGATYYVRLNTLIGGAWYASTTSTFVMLGNCSVQTVFVPISLIEPIPPPMVNPLPAPIPTQLPAPNPPAAPIEPAPSPTPPPTVNPLPY